MTAAMLSCDCMRWLRAEEKRRGELGGDDGISFPLESLRLGGNLVQRLFQHLCAKAAPLWARHI